MAQSEKDHALVAKNQALATNPALLAQIASATIDKEGPVTAALLALRGLPGVSLDPPERPIVPGHCRLPGDPRLGVSRRSAACFQHEDSVLSAVFSPDGARVLTASADNTARLWAPPPA